MPNTMGPHTLTMQDVARRASGAIRVPLAAALNCELIDPHDPTVGVRFQVTGIASNGVGGLHSAALSAGLELAAFLAVVPRLAEHEHAVTTTVALQLIRAVPEGEWVDARGSVDRRTGRLAFVSVVAVHEHNVVARGQITKAIIDTR